VSRPTEYRLDYREAVRLYVCQRLSSNDARLQKLRMTSNGNLRLLLSFIDRQKWNVTTVGGEMCFTQCSILVAYCNNIIRERLDKPVVTTPTSKCTAASYSPHATQRTQDAATNAT